VSVRWWVAVGVVVSGAVSALANFVRWWLAAVLGPVAGGLTLLGALWLERFNRDVDLAALAGV
jgi:hypothetical protein